MGASPVEADGWLAAGGGGICGFFWQPGPLRMIDIAKAVSITVAGQSLPSRLACN
jgi:hypothetical protein